MESETSSEKRRVPQRARGERRVAALLDAAAEIIGEVGYEAATMTAIAERAGASIGAVYQYFPNKEAVAQALRAQYAEEMEQRWTPITQAAAALSTKVLVDRIFVVLVDFLVTRPAYIPLLSAPVRYQRDPAARNRLREQFAQLFRKRDPSLTPQAAFRIANVTLQIVKGMNPLYAAADDEERSEVLAEFKLALTSYLRTRLSRGSKEA